MGVAALLVIAKQGLLPDGAASVAAVFVVLPLAMAAAAAHLRWPDSAMTVSFVTGAAATVATGSLTF